MFQAFCESCLVIISEGDRPGRRIFARHPRAIETRSHLGDQYQLGFCACQNAQAAQGVLYLCQM